jgi:hypothetical protein
MFISIGFVSAMVFAQTPPVPQGLDAQSGFNGGACLNWGSSAGADGYIVYKAVDSASFARIAMVRHSGYMDWWVYPWVVYQYYVTAFTYVDSVMYESAPSNIALFAVGHHHVPLPGEGVIGGKVIDDENGEPLKGAVIHFYQPGKLFTLKTHTDSSGIYWAALDTGRYIMRADRFEYMGEWFDNVRRADSATVVYLYQDSIIIANFGLRSLPTPVNVTVTGTITDSLTGLPIEGALVGYLRPHRWFRQLQAITGFFGGFWHERLDLPALGKFFGVVWYGLSDQNGNYSANLIRGMRYISFAFKPGYIPEFYNNKLIPFEADRLVFMNDSSGINFALETNPIAQNTLTGSVKDSSGSGVPSHVVLFRKVGYSRDRVRYTMTDSLGNYEFHNLVSGIFYVKAIPVDGYAPAWFSRFDCAVRNWRFADTVQVSGDVSGIDICVGTSARYGFGRIAGSVYSQSGNLLAEMPEQNATVYAVSVITGDVFGYDISESDGSYAIDDLPEGAFNLVVDKEGYDANAVQTIAIDASNGYEVNDAALEIVAEVLGVGDEVSAVPTKFYLYQNYPNPFNPTTEIRFDLPKASVVTVKIYNVIGQRIAVLFDGNLDVGGHSIQWNAAESGSGIYFVKVIATPADGSTFTAVRKMLLMK